MQHHVWWACQIRGMVALGRGDFEEAYQQLIRISPPGLLAPHVPYALEVLLDLVEAAMRTGREAEAAAHVAAMQEANIAQMSSRLALVVGASAAMVAPDDRARELFQETLALPGVERWQFDLARVRLAYGERLRRKRAMVESRVQLNAALAIFERLGARPWVERATVELRATGQTKPRAGDNVLDRLTPQELEIATLAASGLTNKQIAERLFLSHRTVGGHLHRAFPKLGVATRAALRDALESPRPEQLPAQLAIHRPGAIAAPAPALAAEFGSFDAKSAPRRRARAFDLGARCRWTEMHLTQCASAAQPRKGRHHEDRRHRRHRAHRLEGRRRAHRARPRGRPGLARLGINTITGEGLAAALDGASVVIDVSNSPNFEYATALEFFADVDPATC